MKNQEMKRQALEAKKLLEKSLTSCTESGLALTVVFVIALTVLLECIFGRINHIDYDTKLHVFYYQQFGKDFHFDSEFGISFYALLILAFLGLIISMIPYAKMSGLERQSLEHAGLLKLYSRGGIFAARINQCWYDVTGLISPYKYLPDIPWDSPKPSCKIVDAKLVLNTPERSVDYPLDDYDELGNWLAKANRLTAKMPSTWGLVLRGSIPILMTLPYILFWAYIQFIFTC
ncbi:MAG: hypothetical protein WCT08_04365 [Patescibacteria group bacterium]|jgi:hypothetical protein